MIFFFFFCTRQNTVFEMKRKSTRNEFWKLKDDKGCLLTSITL